MKFLLLIILSFIVLCARTQKSLTIPKSHIEDNEEVTIKINNEEDDERTTSKIESEQEINKEFKIVLPDKKIERKGISGSKKDNMTLKVKPMSKEEELRFYEDYNKKLMEGYKQWFENLENEDVNLQAYHGGDQEIGYFQGVMDSVPILRNMLGKTCFRDIGCFSAMDYQDMSKRPIPVLPLSPSYLDVKFHLYTLESKIIPTNLSYSANSSELLKTSFNPSYRTVVVVHGFRSGLEPWMEGIRDYFFTQKDSGEYNIVLVNWEKGAKVPMYTLAASNTRVVGALVAFFINQIVETFGISNDKFYLIGHSLGAHTSGYAGKRLHSPKLSRITGLDPAGPGFHFESPTMKLHASDAAQVDIIHTDCADSVTEGLGSSLPFGYHDFYPNRGSFQPGCHKTMGVMNLVTAALSGEDVSCSHQRACTLAHSLGFKQGKEDQECYPMAYQCQNWETFLEGKCANCGDDQSKCRLMGLYPHYWKNIKSSKQTIGYKYFVNTSPAENFCQQHYQIAIHVSENSDMCSGRLEFTLMTSVFGRPLYLTFDRIMSRLTPGKIHTILVTFDYSFSRVKRLSIEWKRWKDNERLQRGKKLEILFIEINHMSHFDQKVRDKNSVILCPINSPEVRATENTEFGELFTYDECDKSLNQSARVLSSEMLKPLTVSEDIVSVDYDSKETINHKIIKSNFPIMKDKHKNITNFFSFG